MGWLLAGDLDDEAVEVHRGRGKAHGHSLQQAPPTVIETATAKSLREKLAVAELVRRFAPAGSPRNFVHMIREDRER